jgi:hypothetical protein
MRSESAEYRQRVNLDFSGRSVFSTLILWHSDEIVGNNRDAYGKSVSDAIEELAKKFVTDWNLDNKADDPALPQNSPPRSKHPPDDALPPGWSYTKPAAPTAKGDLPPGLRYDKNAVAFPHGASTGVTQPSPAPCKSGAETCKPWERDWSKTNLQPGSVVDEDGVVQPPPSKPTGGPQSSSESPVSSVANHTRSTDSLATSAAVRIAEADATKAESGTSAEVVTVKYRGPVSLAPFKCDPITRSSFIERVCYDTANSYMLIDLSGTWYHYCEIDASTVSSLMAAESMGRFYNASIKGRFDCRTHHIPEY